MNSTQRQLMKYLHGELDPARAREFERRLEAEPELRDELEAMRAVWASLDTPAPAPAPPHLVERTVARLAAEPRIGWSPGLRWAAAAAVLAGIGLGSAVGLTLDNSLVDPAAGYPAPSMAERYVTLLEEGE